MLQQRSFPLDCVLLGGNQHFWHVHCHQGDELHGLTACFVAKMHAMLVLKVQLFTLVLLGLQEVVNTFPCSLSIAYGFSYIPLIECVPYQADLQFLEIKVFERPDDT